MQTFFPYPSPTRSAKSLDRLRLGCQRKEAFQIIDILGGRYSAWRHHPIIKMWFGYVPALKYYYNCMLDEWERRGYRNIKLRKFKIQEKIIFPNWVGNKEFHDSHKAALLRKNPEYYKQLGWNVKDVDYIWPISNKLK